MIVIRKKRGRKLNSYQKPYFLNIDPIFVTIHPNDLTLEFLEKSEK